MAVQNITMKGENLIMKRKKGKKKKKKKKKELKI